MENPPAPDSVYGGRAMWSANGRDRTVDEAIRYVIVHGTWMVDDDEALARLCDPVVGVSAHYYITRDGGVVQVVPESRVAYHAGKSFWEDPEKGALNGLNAWSLGIEIGNAGPFENAPTPEQEKDVSDWSKAEPYTEAQYQALVALLRDIMARNPQVVAERVLGHEDIAPGRKIDPGPHFDWQRLVEAGVCVRPPVTGKTAA